MDTEKTETYQNKPKKKLRGFGGEIKEKKAGSFGDVACTSFFPAKPLGCYGDGGAIFTDDENLAAKMKSIRVHGSGLDKYENSRIGINGRLDSIQAEVLNIKLKYLDEYNSNRKIMANNYNLAFSDIDEIITPVVSESSDHVYHQYTLRLSNEKRDNFKNYLNNLGIPTMIYYPIPIHKQKPYANNQILENTEKLSHEVVSLPIHTELETSNQEYIIENVIKYFK